MAVRILNTVLVGVVGWWAWTGPIADYRQKSLAETLAENARTMQFCLHGEAFAEGAGSARPGDPEKRCAARHRLYRYNGQWWSYDQTGRVQYRNLSG